MYRKKAQLAEYFVAKIYIWKALNYLYKTVKNG